MLFFLLINVKMPTTELSVRKFYNLGARNGLGMARLGPGASFTKKNCTISLKMSVRSFLRSAYVGFTKTS